MLDYKYIVTNHVIIFFGKKCYKNIKIYKKLILITFQQF